MTQVALITGRKICFWLELILRACHVNSKCVVPDHNQQSVVVVSIVNPVVQNHLKLRKCYVDLALDVASTYLSLYLRGQGRSTRCLTFSEMDWLWALMAKEFSGKPSNYREAHDPSLTNSCHLKV